MRRAGRWLKPRGGGYSATPNGKTKPSPPVGRGALAPYLPTRIPPQERAVRCRAWQVIGGKRWSLVLMTRMEVMRAAPSEGSEAGG